MWYRLRPSGVIYDVTNTYLYGRHCPLRTPGHDKEQVKGRQRLDAPGAGRRVAVPILFAARGHAPEGRLSIQHRQQSVIIVNQKTFVAPRSAVPSLPIATESVGGAALEGAFGKSVKHRK